MDTFFAEVVTGSDDDNKQRKNRREMVSAVMITMLVTERTSVSLPVGALQVSSTSMINTTSMYVCFRWILCNLQ